MENNLHSNQDVQTVPVYKWEGHGCLICGADDDHSLLLICELCNGEYHTYCLEPPLKSVPEGDFYCDQCKPHVNAVPQKPRVPLPPVVTGAPFPPFDDDLDDLINALPPIFVARFGEIIWAAGGVGFGWWPACIYDPRLTVGGARCLAKKNLGKKHLVYFFECHDAPFSVLSECKICGWEDGFHEDYDLGRTARAMSKTRGVLFEKALMVASLEFEKPVELRLDWNHQDEDIEMKTGRTLRSSQTRVDTKKQNDIDNKKKQSMKIIQAIERTLDDNKNGKRKRRTTPMDPLSMLEGNVVNARMNRPRRGSRGKQSAISVEAMNEAEALATALELSAAEEEKRVRDNSASFYSANLNENTDTYDSSKISGIKSSEGDVNHFMAQGAEKIQMKSIFFRIYLRFLPSILKSANIDKSSDEISDMDCYNIGFIRLENTDISFEDVRNVIQNEIFDDGDMTTSLPQRWKFFAPSLGPMSEKQEKSLCIKQFIAGQKNQSGNLGSLHSPIKLFVQDVSKGLIERKDVGVQVGSHN